MNKKNKNLFEYRPNLVKQKKVTLKLDKINNIKEEIYKPSNILTSIKELPPSLLAEKLDTIIEKLDNIIKGMSNALKNRKINDVDFKTYEKAIDNNDISTMDLFENDNAKDISGLGGIELYYPFKKMYDRLSYVSNSFKEQNYGNNVKLQEMKEKDNNILDTLLNSEQNKEYNNINYSAIAIDYGINNILNNYLDKINEIISNYTIKPYENIEIPKNDIVNTTFSLLFDNNVDITEKDKIKLRRIMMSDSQKNSINKVYDKKGKFLKVLSNIDDIFDLDNSEIKTLMISSLNNLYNSTKDTMVDMYKSFMNDILYINDYLNSVGDKQFIRNSYKNYTK